MKLCLLRKVNVVPVVVEALDVVHKRFVIPVGPVDMVVQNIFVISSIVFTPEL